MSVHHLGARMYRWYFSTINPVAPFTDVINMLSLGQKWWKVFDVLIKNHFQVGDDYVTFTLLILLYKGEFKVSCIKYTV